VRDNIRYGRPDGRRGERAAAMAGCSGHPGFPQGLDTLVGERGVTLSGGQRQRVALARALLLDPRILILDDSLSSVDTQTEEHILGHLRDMQHGRTLILISHRISTVKDSDQMVVVEDGEIVERGGHADLVAIGGIYAGMYREQQVRESLEAE
jgi:ATP-binding cassette subfamily B protein